MSGFAKLSDYKYNVLYKLITNENLIKALVSTDEDFLNYDLTSFNPTTLIYSQIFPYQYTNNIEDAPKTYITMSFGNYKYVNNAFKSGIFSVFIFTHKSLMKTDSGLRTDYILNEVDSMFNKSNNDVGVYTLEIYSGGDFKVNDDYFGSFVSYKFTDFQ
jgi:hypothetical protein